MAHVEPRANQENMSGNTRGWIGFSAPGREEGGGIANFAK